ncbi:TorF family putative porin [Sphingorhabdus sp. EL138]|uniref:TorF family putative porin n=1 Tax=Sphingorhabdus sp. EL138 TaxID=2073156 RepID=UPI0025E1F6BF|nr:TorF family putative porin [Sphingorhabdus sp. EL138]
MRNSILKLASMSVAISAIALSAPAFAQEAAEETAGPVTLTGGVAVVSDYRFRGVSLSDKDFAVQPYLTVSHESGLYVGAWGSNLADNAGDDVEVDLYAGFAGGEDVTYDISATYYTYPGVSSFNYVELTGKLGSTVGPATVGVQLSYVPSQDNTGNNDNIYFGTNATIAVPNSPISIVGSMGVEDGAFTAGSEKVDWSLGLTAAVSGFTLGVSYVDANRETIFAPRDSAAGVVFSVSYGF